MKSTKAYSQEISTGDIWDEPVLLGVQDLIAQHPPDPEVFGSQVRFIKERIDHVVAINDLFAAVLFGTSKELLAAGCRLPLQPQVAQGLACLQANGALEKLRSSISQPQEKLASFVQQLVKEAPSISESLTRCLEAVCARQELGTVNCLLVTGPT